MDTTIFYMGSVTSATRGKTVLERQGMRAFIQRSHAENSGCGYTLRVPGDGKRARALLEAARIPVRRQERGEPL